MTLYRFFVTTGHPVPPWSDLRHLRPLSDGHRHTPLPFVYESQHVQRYGKRASVALGAIVAVFSVAGEGNRVVPVVRILNQRQPDLVQVVDAGMPSAPVPEGPVRTRGKRIAGENGNNGK